MVRGRVHPLGINVMIGDWRRLAALSGVTMDGSASINAKDAGGALLWTGRSGRRYLMSRVVEERARMAAAQFYALVEHGVIRWAGTAEDLIADPMSRQRFRTVSAAGAQMLSMAAPGEPLAIMTLAWDLEGTRQYPDRNAA